MKIFRTEELSVRYLITHIESENNNKTRRNFQEDQKKRLEQCGIKRSERKQAKNELNKLINGEKGGKHINQLNKGPYGVNIKQSKYLTLNPLWQVHDINKTSC